MGSAFGTMDKSPHGWGVKSAHGWRGGSSLITKTASLVLSGFSTTLPQQYPYWRLLNRTHLLTDTYGNGTEFESGFVGNYLGNEVDNNNPVSAIFKFDRSSLRWIFKIEQHHSSFYLHIATYVLVDDGTYNPVGTYTKTYDCGFSWLTNGTVQCTAFY